MEKFSEDIGEKVIFELKELIRLIEEKFIQNGNKQDNTCGLYPVHENIAE